MAFLLPTLFLFVSCTAGTITYSSFSSNQPARAFQYYCPNHAFVIGAPGSAYPNIIPASNAVFSVSPPLPPGLGINASTGIISGTSSLVTASTPYVVTQTVGSTATLALINITTNNGFVVNNLGDGSDFTSGNFICETGTGNGICTYRAAIGEINGEGSPDSIVVLPPGTITFGATGTTATKPMNIYGSCNGTPTIINGNNAWGYLFSTNNGNGSLNNLTIQNGHYNFNGAGINLAAGSSGTFALNNVNVTGNVLTGSGGAGLYFGSSGTLNINNSTFSNNGTGGSYPGGGIEGAGTGPITITGSTFSGNQGTTGGAIYMITTGPLTVSNSTFNGNSATQYGGAIYFGGSGGGSIAQTSFAGNSSTTGGGGLYIGATLSLAISQSNFSSNSSAGNGAAIFVTSSTPTINITRSSFENNTDTGAGGGAVFFSGGTYQISNSTFANNSATGNGGAVALLGSSTTTLTNNTFYGNSTAASGNGGGLYANASSYTLINNIFNFNTAAGITNSCSTAAGGTSLGHNIFDDTGNCAQSGSDQPVTFALLGSLQNFGGITYVMVPTTGSPAITNGDLPDCTSAPVSAVDELGRARGVGSTCDIGAYETSH